MNVFWDQFNIKQRQAITAPLEHMIINAAAGTGKTSTLAARIIYMQTELDIAPHSILAISFSRTARVRLLEKITEFCKHLHTGSPVKVFTFHGLAFRIIRMAITYGETHLKPRFEVMNTEAEHNYIFASYRDQLLEGVAQNLDRENAHIAFLKIINELRQGSDELEPIHTHEELDPQYAIEVDIGLNMNVTVSCKDVKTVWRRYERILKHNNATDYNGLISEAVRIMSISNGETSNRVRERLQAIVVDEFQDTSRAQNQLLFSLAGSDIAVNVVGDPDQTIYTFNGSSVENMKKFGNDALDTNINVLPQIHMVENYRSTSAILDVANKVRQTTDFDRLLVVAKELKHSKSFDQTDNPVRLVHAPRLELAAEFVAIEIQRLIQEEGVKEHEIAVLVRKNSEYAPQGTMVINALRNTGLLLNTNNDKPLSSVKEESDFMYHFYQEPDTYGKRIDEILEASHEVTLPKYLSIEKFKSYLIDALDSGSEYCYEAAELLYEHLTDESSSADSSGIQVRTVHSAKGEEYKIVFLMYLGDRSFPHGSRPDYEEERRLLYVGVTRAREKLYILGRPGIHQEDFFSDCKTSNSCLERYMVTASSKSIEDDTIVLDSIEVSLINRARAKHISDKVAEREELRQLFEDE
ncbi:ATP-dependent helicase [Paenibacillus sacheonensis]|uniref:DNA 3'-5' helicase n=1 Tax=Paenibacillus sacheonensis TaxID=742054 RepID=A0A7X4YUP7_9BACL|nr:ATP-dependent helicase [Paenibacillus sacheonensis]MBM7568078.1 DNA helicase-2/ATP-dependent DNA helicase PcrA [Paenibacillus sacheonensis]NBC72893.1 UvrD-helicase domain-containing protein [Paenibacillus sacheonensis]